MNDTDQNPRVTYLRPKPHPYSFYNVGRALSEYMRQAEYLRILVNIFESAPHLYQDFIPDEDMFKDEAPTQTRNHEQPSQYVTDDIDDIQWRIDICAVPNATYYRGNRAEIYIVSCVVADLSGGSVQIKLTCHKPEAKRLVEAIEAEIRKNWLDEGGSAIQPEVLAPVSTLSAAAQTRIEKKPWKLIPEKNEWHQKAVMLWWQGNDVEEIEKKIPEVTKKTINNVLTLYRKNPEYGPTVVPTAKELRRQGLR